LVARPILSAVRGSLLLAVALPALFVGPAAGGTEQERLECLGRIQRDYGVCVHQAQERCRQELEGRLGGCFGGAECSDECLASQNACTKEPLLGRTGCRLACQADGRVAQQGCRVEVDRDACRRMVRMKSMKCKEQCNRRAAPMLQRCREAFSECLRACARRP
jgi:hypothetical protein